MTSIVRKHELAHVLNIKGRDGARRSVAEVAAAVGIGVGWTRAGLAWKLASAHS